MRASFLLQRKKSGKSPSLREKVQVAQTQKILPALKRVSDEQNALLAFRGLKTSEQQLGFFIWIRPSLPAELWRLVQDKQLFVSVV